MTISKINRTGTINTPDKKEILDLLDKLVEFGIFNYMDTFTSTNPIVGAVSCTQTEYDNLPVIVPGVLYVIIEE